MQSEMADAAYIYSRPSSFSRSSAWKMSKVSYDLLCELLDVIKGPSISESRR